MFIIILWGPKQDYTKFVLVSLLHFDALLHLPHSAL